ncbi:hypothetical protein SARC_08215 [Sphaeroforma arctica JP610]|uniref:Uncharacterized protein n=1 Tax=Sphaeroforma arctica JP610 TaxID=667725 RepID=A0A0L0FTZ1_9EUKA|nr:hypothetical protein SARC_08215 [Sphaeroforma arctica JP610]KNC79388.1 hypothetical protein SARC_08215 [Sphaeroforma arctica JP610]|eukprot:XP_014153290.1 hypothetical protein SARC_08215 [Sphaeroforma arctica JP610]
MVGVGRQVLHTQMTDPPHRFAKDWLGPAIVKAHVAPVLHCIKTNKEYRVHVKNIKAYIPPICRDEMIPRGTTANSIYAYFLDFTPDDEMFFLKQAHEVATTTGTLSGIKRCFRFAVDETYRQELYTIWELKHNATMLLDAIPSA